ncbi:hypothetical protein Psi02_24900 [Planotetraspora silvatica]|uniref:DUF3887 domain-containing protein n=1 Tax=Planotetraspora silvatica TaxID=234614 RepID=A0A8J3UMP2_9ACTN|nr:DUF3887 domain-containing protein [Planotetraspora silvatica]GII46066.1 hypothetical protein Psi02_24900 [Planotetraspora silvatica]
MDERLGELAEQVARSARHLAEVAKQESGAPGELATVRLAQQLDALSGVTLRVCVERARAAGHTWQELGDLLGVSRQAAFQRFGKPIDPRTGAPMSNTAQTDAAGRATALLADWTEGRYEQVVADFDATMSAALSATELAAAWAQVVGTVGTLERTDEPLVRAQGDLTVVDIPLEFEAGEMKARVTFNADRTVGGLFILNPDVP